MDTLIEYRNGNTMSLLGEGFITKDMVIGPIELVSDTTKVDWRPGVVREFIGYGTRKIVVSILFIAKDQLDFALRRDKLLGIFSDIEPFYLYEGRPTYKTQTYAFEKPGEKYGENSQLPTSIQLLRGKRYNVIQNSMSDIEQNGLLGSCTIEFQTWQLPFAESKLTTENPQQFTENVWQTGQGLRAIPISSRTYKFTNTQNFSIYNAGNTDVRNDLRDMFLEIEFIGVSSGLKIFNLSTNTNFQLTGTTTSSERLLITTPYVYTINQNNVFSRTNKSLFTLAPGFNVISVTGSTNFEINFKFRFYYK